MYLWHWILISYAHVLYGKLNSSTKILRIELVAVSFVLAVLTYFFVEKPIRFGVWARAGKIYALAAGMTAIGVAGLVVYLTGGLPERGNIKNLADAVGQLKGARAYLGEKGEKSRREGRSYVGTEFPYIYPDFTNVGSNETIAIIGDSHAEAAYWGIAELGRRLDYNTLCLLRLAPAADKINWIEADVGIDADSLKGIPVIFDILKEKHEIRKVFICIRGAFYMDIINEQMGDGKNDVGYDLFKESLQSYVDALHECGKEVFVVGEHPILPSPYNYAGRPFSPRSRRDAYPETRKVDILRFYAKYHRLLSEIHDATIIDAIEPMCKEGIALAFTEDGIPLTYDGRHLTYAGSVFQAEHMYKPYLER